MDFNKEDSIFEVQNLSIQSGVLENQFLADSLLSPNQHPEGVSLENLIPTDPLTMDFVDGFGVNGIAFPLSDSLAINYQIGDIVSASDDEAILGVQAGDSLSNPITEAST